MSGIIGDNTSESSGSIATVSGVTTSSSDPAVDTNPSGGVGTMFVNSTSGEMFICTDSTTDENVWTNVGDGTGDIQPFIYQGTQSGYTSGSGDPTTSPANTAIEKHSYTSDGDATDWADLSAHRSYAAGHSSATYGYTSGGEPNYYIEKFPFASATTSVSTGYYLSTGAAARNNVGTTSDENYGYAAGGSPATDVIDRFSYSTDGTATDVGDLLQSQYGGAGASSETHGYHSGGVPYVDTIQKFAFAASADATDVDDLTTTIQSATGHQSSTHGYKAGGYTNNGDGYTTGADSIQKFTFASDAAATDVGTTTVGRSKAASGSSTTYGYSSGGGQGTSGNVIEKFTFASDSNATDVGDLVISRGFVCGQQY